MPERTENGVVGEAHMKFFLPVQEAKTAEEGNQAIRKFIEKQTGWPVSDTRYYEIHYRRNDQAIRSLGEPDPLNGETVFAIFKPKNGGVVQ
jgi:hypothetical protein